MALIKKCSCGRLVSGSFDACPGCGGSTIGLPDHKPNQRAPEPLSSVPNSPEFGQSDGRSGRILGYPNSEWVIAGVVGVALLVALIIFSLSRDQDVPQEATDIESSTPLIGPPSDLKAASEIFADVRSAITDGRISDAYLAKNKLVEYYESSPETAQAKVLLEEKQAQLDADAEKTRKRAEAEKSYWTYSSNSDEMTGSIVKYASVTAMNSVNFEFPYQGAQYATLMLRRHPRHGKDTILSLDRGQFLCNSYDGCSILVRFDDQRPMSFSASPSSSHDSTVLFIQGFDRFVRLAKKAKVAKIEATFYREGGRTFEFRVQNLDLN